MKPSWTETGHQGLENFSLSLSLSLLLLLLLLSLLFYSHLLSTRHVGNFKVVSH